MIRYIIVIGLCILSMLMYCANDGFDIAEDIIDAIRDHINEQHIYIYIYDGKDIRKNGTDRKWENSVCVATYITGAIMENKR